MNIYDNKNNKQNESIFEYTGYYQDYLDSIGINLDEHYTLGDKISLDIDHSRFVHYFRNMAEEHQVKNYIPRPFYPDSDMRQAVCMMHLGYCKENATERNIGLNSIDNQTLSASFRLNYTINPNLTIQYYAQPFISKGQFKDFKYVTKLLKLVTQRTRRHL